LGEGWWIASDGKWYPADAHPDARAKQPPPVDPNIAPAEGWWKASDGNWYAPELHPDNIAAVTPSSPATRTAVTRASRTLTTLGVTATGDTGEVAAGVAATTSRNGLMNGHHGGGSDGLRPTNGPGPVGRSNGYGATSPRSDREDVARPLASHPSPGGQKRVLPSGDLTFDPMNDPATLFGDWQPPAVSPVVARPAEGFKRPVTPAFGKTNAPPRGPSSHQQLPATQPRQQVAPQLERADGFDKWLQSLDAAPLPLTTRVSPSPQALTGVAEMPQRARGTMGGPASAVPRISSSEADFFVMKPSNLRPKREQNRARSKLSTAVFFLVLLVVLVAVAVAFVYFHAHGIGPHFGSG